MNDIRRLPEIPQLVSDTYMKLRYVFDCLRLHWNEVHGEGYPSCHVIARALVQRFDCLRYCDGLIPYFSKPGQDYQGARQMLATENEGKVRLTPVVSNYKNHSWLVFREYPDFIIDPAPIGAIPVLSSPILIFRDPWAFPYTEEALDAATLARISEEKINEFLALLGRAVLHERKKVAS